MSMYWINRLDLILTAAQYFCVFSAFFAFGTGLWLFFERTWDNEATPLVKKLFFGFLLTFAFSLCISVFLPATREMKEYLGIKPEKEYKAK